MIVTDRCYLILLNWGSFKDFTSLFYDFIGIKHLEGRIDHWNIIAQKGNKMELWSIYQGEEKGITKLPLRSAMMPIGDIHSAFSSS